MEKFDSTKYKNDYTKQNYDRLTIALPKGYKEKLIEIGEGKSIAQTIVNLVNEKEAGK